MAQYAGCAAFIVPSRSLPLPLVLVTGSGVRTDFCISYVIKKIRCKWQPERQNKRSIPKQEAEEYGATPLTDKEVRLRTGARPAPGSVWLSPPRFPPVGPRKEISGNVWPCRVSIYWNFLSIFKWKEGVPGRSGGKGEKTGLSFTADFFFNSFHFRPAPVAGIGV